MTTDDQGDERSTATPGEAGQSVSGSFDEMAEKAIAVGKDVAGRVSDVADDAMDAVVDAGGKLAEAAGDLKKKILGGK